jgi:hypothetical protein
MHKSKALYIDYVTLCEFIYCTECLFLSASYQKLFDQFLQNFVARRSTLNTFSKFFVVYICVYVFTCKCVHTYDVYIKPYLHISKFIWILLLRKDLIAQKFVLCHVISVGSLNAAVLRNTAIFLLRQSYLKWFFIQLSVKHILN